MAATLQADTIKNASSATANITLDTAGNATVGNTLAMGSSFLRNRIINGDMRIDARNAGASVTITGGSTIYSADRWRCPYSQNSKYSAQQVTDAPSTFSNSLKVTSLSAFSSPAAGDYFSIQQIVEGYNIADFGFGAAGAKTITLSFWVKSSLTGTFGAALGNSGWSRAYPFSYSVSSANTWEQKTVTIAGDTTGTWVTNNGAGLAVNFALCYGSTYGNGTAGAWVGSDLESVTGAVNVLGTNGATWQVTGVQLEVGSVATPFERRQYGQELALCQRYYYRNTAPTSSDYIGMAGTVYSSTTAPCPVPFPVQMRIAPTTLEQDGTAGHYLVLAGSTFYTSTSVPVFNSATQFQAIVSFTTSGMTTAQACICRSNAAGTYLAWSAEL